MQNPTFFNSININTPLEEIYKRLGYRSGITLLSAAQKKDVEKYIKEALSSINLKASVLILPIEKKGKDSLTIEKKIFKSRILSSLLKNSDKVFLCGVTAGNRIIKSIEKFQKKDLTRAVVYDAVASEMADAGFDWLINYFNQNLLRKNQRLTSKRISCGYSDFSIKYQKKIYDLLKLNRIGVKISKKLVLIPEKSATAVLGVIEL